MLDEQIFLILNAVHLKRIATAADIANATKLVPESVREVLSDAVNRSWALDLNGQHMLAPDGTQEVLAHYREAYAELRADQAVEAWYAKFEKINAEFIRHVSDWQASGDERARNRLMRTVERLVKALGEITPRLSRYSGYVERFERGLALIDQGQVDYVAKPTIDSVHNVWFEFHEDILSVLGRPREM